MFFLGHSVDQHVIDMAIRKQHMCLSACVKAKGRQFGHKGHLLFSVDRCLDRYLAL